MASQTVQRGRQVVGRLKRSLRRRSAAAIATLNRGRERGNPLEAYFRSNDGRLIHKWTHYFDIYDRHFAPYRGRPIKVLEFGVSHGGSLQMWKHYFGPRAHIVGVDIMPVCADFAEERVRIVIGDQADRAFLADLVAKHGPFDVVIEDGGHHMDQQINSFEVVWPSVVDGGVFLIEDLHTSYWPSFGGGLRRQGSFIEYAKNLVDQQHAWHSRGTEGFQVDEYTRSIRGMHVYDSIVVFDKGVVPPPQHDMTGTASF